MPKKLKEQIDYGNYPERMDPGSERSLGDPEKNLYGTNPAMPQGNLDVERLGSDRFKKVVDKLRAAINQPDLTPRFVQGIIMQEYQTSVMGAKSIENRFIEELEELAVQASLKITETPEGRYNIDAKLTGSVEGIGAEKFQFEPKPKPNFNNPQNQEGGEEGNQGNENNDRFNANVLTRNEKFDLEVHKRNIINGIIQGASKKGHYIFQNPEVKAKLDQMDPRLYGYYLKLMAINDYFYFTMDELIQSMGNTGHGIGGREDLTGNNPPEEGGMPGGDEGEEGEEGEEGGEENLQGHEVSEHNIRARGILFPILCHEVIKGIEEALGKFGYSNEPDVASAVIGQSDTLPNEVMSLRIGPELVDRIRTCLPEDMFNEENYGIKPFFYKILYEISPIPFLDLIGKVVSQDQRDQTTAREAFREIFEQAKAMKQRYTEKRSASQQAPPEEDMDDFLRQLGIGGNDEGAEAPPEAPAAAPAEERDLAGLGINALNFEMNRAIDNEDWELARKIQRMIERKEGNQR